MTVLYDNLTQLVNGQAQNFQAYANDAYANATQALQSLGSFTFQPNLVTASFVAPGGAGAFVAPPAPTFTSAPFVEPEAPEEPNIGSVRLDLSGVGNAPPDPNLGNLTFSPPPAPGQLTAVAPSGPPTLDDVVFPEAPNYVLPDLPTFEQLNIPDAPTIQLPTFTAARPEITFTPPVQNFAFTELAYSSALLDSVKARISTMLLGGTGLPAAIEQALFDRARTREEETAFRALQEVDDEFVSRGWSEPNGILQRRRMQARQNNQNQQNALSRQVEIENKQIEIENLRFAVTQGIALEQILLQAHLTVEQRRFEAARFAFESLIAIFDARVRLFNAEVQAYQADAQVFRDRVQAALVEAELYKTEMEGQRVLGEINKTLAERYETQVRGVLAEVEIYRTVVQARAAQVDANRSRIEAYRAEVEGYGQQVRAWQIEWEGYASRVRAEIGKAEFADATARIYATRVGAWQTKNQVAFERLRGDIAVEENELRKFDGDLRRYLALIEKERTRIAADAQVFDGHARIYAAAGQVALSSTEAENRAFQLAIEKGRADADTELKKGEINLQASIQASAQLLEALRSVAAVSGQLAASAMSAINISGSYSGSLQASDSRNDNRNRSASFEGNGTVAWI